MSGGFSQTFTTAADGDVTVSFDYRLFNPRQFDRGEASEALLAIDGGLIGSGGNDYLFRIDDGGDSGWRAFTTTVFLEAGEHTIDLGGFLSRKTYHDEVSTVRFDNVYVEGPGEVPLEPPVAGDDAATVLGDNPTPIDVLANDTDPSFGETLSVDSVTQPENGTVTIADDGLSVTYLRADDFSGTDAFTYTVTDGNGGFDTATVSVDVKGGVIVDISDNFESNSVSGGIGWASPWELDGGNDARFVTGDGPFEGNRHLRVRDEATATRSADLAGVTDATLSFYWKARGLENSDETTVRIFDGDEWHDILEIENGQDNNRWNLFTLDLSPFDLNADFQIQFEMDGSANNDRLLIDLLSIA